MTFAHISAKDHVLVAIDIAKAKHAVLMELPLGQRKRMLLHNKRADFDSFAQYLKSLAAPCLLALEPTADYHRNLAYFLKAQG